MSEEDKETSLEELLERKPELVEQPQTTYSTPSDSQRKEGVPLWKKVVVGVAGAAALLTISYFAYFKPRWEVAWADKRWNQSNAQLDELQSDEKIVKEEVPVLQDLVTTLDSVAECYQRASKPGMAANAAKHRDFAKELLKTYRDFELAATNAFKEVRADYKTLVDGQLRFSQIPVLRDIEGRSAKVRGVYSNLEDKEAEQQAKKFMKEVQSKITYMEGLQRKKTQWMETEWQSLQSEFYDVSSLIVEEVSMSKLAVKSSKALGSLDIKTAEIEGQEWYKYLEGMDLRILQGFKTALWHTSTIMMDYNEFYLPVKQWINAWKKDDKLTFGDLKNLEDIVELGDTVLMVFENYLEIIKPLEKLRSCFEERKRWVSDELKGIRPTLQNLRKHAQSKDEWFSTQFTEYKSQYKDISGFHGLEEGRQALSALSDKLLLVRNTKWYKFLDQKDIDKIQRLYAQINNDLVTHSRPIAGKGRTQKEEQPETTREKIKTQTETMKKGTLADMIGLKRFEHQLLGTRFLDTIFFNHLNDSYLFVQRWAELEKLEGDLRGAMWSADGSVLVRSVKCKLLAYGLEGKVAEIESGKKCIDFHGWIGAQKALVGESIRDHQTGKYRYQLSKLDLVSKKAEPLVSFRYNPSEVKALGSADGSTVYFLYDPTGIVGAFKKREARVWRNGSVINIKDFDADDISPDGSFLVNIHKKGYVEFLDVKSNRIIKMHEDSEYTPNWCMKAKISPNGEMIMAGAYRGKGQLCTSADGALIVWRPLSKTISKIKASGLVDYCWSPDSSAIALSTINGYTGKTGLSFYRPNSVVTIGYKTLPGQMGDVMSNMHNLQWQPR